ncbi:mechanosensitive ion channel family protein [Oligoflexaceae bacterium]|nr:mechanosensitive ion channel family protein [Oligoflexaceae bacterium]
MMNFIPPDFSEFFDNGNIFNNILNSFIVVAIIITIRIISVRFIERTKNSNESKLEWKAHIRMATSALMIVCVLIVWGSEIRTFALSLVAIAAAIVIATKELILCLMGGVLKSISRPFKVGDRIELDRYRGDVVEHNFLTTTLFEIGPGRSSHLYTGRRVVFPNSLLLSEGLTNETKRFHYGLHTFIVTLPATVNVTHHKKTLLAAANEVCEEFIVDAQRFLNNLGVSDGIEAPNAEPKVTVSFASGTCIDFVVRIPIHALKSGKTEQAVLDRYIETREEGA